MATRQNTLSKADDFKLMSLMTAELPTYTEGVGAFVVYAREKLGIPQLNKDHIYFRARELDIPLPQAPLRAAVIAIDPRIDELKEQLKLHVDTSRNVFTEHRSELDELRNQLKQLSSQFEVFKLAARHNKS